MTDFFKTKYKDLTPYVPGEQPRGGRYVKLNTNESPFPPSPKAVESGMAWLSKANLYSDPSCTDLIKAASASFGVPETCIIASNGSDEVLSWAFAAFCGEGRPGIFPDVTYGFYPVFAAQNRVPYKVIPLRDDLSLDTERMAEADGTLFIANPNAPTGIALSRDEIEKLVKSKPDRIVVVDEAYVDFGAESALALIAKYENLLVTQTFSKSRSMAGARLGFGFACEKLIRDLNTLRYSFNPYNVNMITQAMGIGALSDGGYTLGNCREIIKNRIFASEELKKIGFRLTDSSANFIFAAHPDHSGREIYDYLRENRILIRHFSQPERIKDYNRITVGSTDEMEKLIAALAALINGNSGK